MAKKGFIIHEENIDDILDLSIEERGELLTYLIAHYRENTPNEPEDKVVKFVARSMCRRMDYDISVYQKKAEAGSIGGKNKSAAKADSNISKQAKAGAKQTEAKPSKPKQTEAESSNAKLSITNTITKTNTITNTDTTPSGEYSDDPDLDDAVRRYIAHRKKIKKPITDEGSVQRLLKKLDGMASTPLEKVAIINQSIDNCWQGLFPLKAPMSTGPHQRADGKDALLRIMKGDA